MEIAPPPPPPPSPIRSMPTALYHKSVKLAHQHPYLVGGMALAMTAGLGYGGYTAYGAFRGTTTGRKLGSKGLVQDGMLKEAIGKLTGPSLSIRRLRYSDPRPIADSAPAGPTGGYPAQSWVYRHCGCSPGQRGRKARTTAERSRREICSSGPHLRPR
jgi:hypothetical protein